MNRRGTWSSAVLVAAVVTSQAAIAADVPPAAPVVRADAAHEPSNGVPFIFRTGWFVETQIGVFTAIGGEKSFSNAQAYEGISFGYDMSLSASWASHLGFFFSAAHGANAGSCRDIDPNSGSCATWTPNKLDPTSTDHSSQFGAPQNFSVFPMEVGARLGFAELLPRFYPYVVATVGYTFLTPQIFQSAPGGGIHFGVGAGVQYGTRLDGLAVGLEVLFRDAFITGPNPPLNTDPKLSLPSLSIFPRISYVF
jgi:opacity protein-like surface antigen